MATKPTADARGRTGNPQSLDLRLLSTAFAHAADPILILDPDGTLIAMNTAAEEAYRCERDAVIGKTVMGLIPTDLHDEFDTLLQRCRNGEKIQNIQTRRRRMTGEVFPVLTTLSAVLDDSGSTIAITAIAKDISDLNQQVDMQRLDHSQLAREARLVSLGEMAAGLAHELNQPLSAISHYCDAALSVARNQPVVNSELVDIIGECYEQSLRAGEILHDMREIISRRRLPHAREDLNAIISDTTRFMMPEIRANRVVVELELATTTPTVLVDRVEIQQVIMNLILNAIEAMDEADCKSRKISIRTAIKGAEARISIEDTGPGVVPEIATSLFGIFQTTKPDGLGLGLWICQSILAAHDGRIWLDAGHRDGAQFCVALPLQTE